FNQLCYTSLLYKLLFLILINTIHIQTVILEIKKNMINLLLGLTKNHRLEVSSQVITLTTTPLLKGKFHKRF
ncbi:hypothetical protein VIGAN_04202700, partial [Vigna angularis var. angularis]